MRIEPDGIRYASCKLYDGNTFVIILHVEDGVENPLDVVGTYRMF